MRDGKCQRQSLFVVMLHKDEQSRRVCECMIVRDGEIINLYHA
jgi:hypothetical protein